MGAKYVCDAVVLSEKPTTASLFKRLFYDILLSREAMAC